MGRGRLPCAHEAALTTADRRAGAGTGAQARIDVSGALIGERWRIGSEVVLEVSGRRIPCGTFQGHTGERQWVKRFTRKGASGAYLRVVEPGEIRAGDPIEIVRRPDHDVTVALMFRAVRTERELRPRLPAAGEALHSQAREWALAYAAERGAR